MFWSDFLLALLQIAIAVFCVLLFCYIVKFIICVPNHLEDISNTLREMSKKQDNSQNKS